MVNAPHNHDVPVSTNEPWECPRCHQHMLVHNGESVYVCLKCGFYKDVADISKIKGLKNEAESGAGAFNVLIAILIAAALAALIL